LAKILEMIEDTKLFSDTICIGRLLDYKSISESQSSQEITDFIHSHSNQSNLAINFSSRESVKSTKRRKLSISSRIEISRGENISKVIEVSEYQSELKKTDTEKQLLQTRTSSIRSAEEIDQLNFSKEQTEQQLQAQIQIPPKQN
jgi:hypothetical protein